MSLFDESALREIIRDEIRTVIRQELGRKPAAAGDYVSVSEAAQIASVQAQTIRAWVRSGKLTEYKAGRVLRVRRSELEAFLAKGVTPDDADASPEQLADRRFRERQAEKLQRVRAGRPTARRPSASPRDQSSIGHGTATQSFGGDPTLTINQLSGNDQ